MTPSDRLTAAIPAIADADGAITREQCQQLAREFGYRNINWLFGTRHPRLRRLADDRRILA
jgi:hypothetical protein